MKDTNLRIPGPVPLPQETLDLMSSQMINHRGQEYADMLDQMTNNLKKGRIIATNKNIDKHQIIDFRSFRESQKEITTKRLSLGGL